MTIRPLAAGASLRYRHLEISSEITVDTALDVPTLLIHGSKTRQPSLAVTQVLAGLLPDARMAAVEGAGHMSPLTRRDAVNRLVLAHIEECAAGKTVASPFVRAWRTSRGCQKANA